MSKRIPEIACFLFTSEFFTLVFELGIILGYDRCLSEPIGNVSIKSFPPNEKSL
jgi:hypothetical protein